MVLTDRDLDRLRDAAKEVDAKSTAAFDLNDLPRLEDVSLAARDAFSTWSTT